MIQIAVDAGFGMTKYFGKVNDEFVKDVYQSGLVYTKDNDSSAVTMTSLRFDGEKWIKGDTVNVIGGETAAFMGTTLPPTVFTKYSPEYFVHAIQFAIHEAHVKSKNTEKNHKVSLAVTFTPTTHEVDVNLIKETLENRKFMVGNVTYSITNVKVLMEGFASYIAHYAQFVWQNRENQNEIDHVFGRGDSSIVVDCGTGTLDIIAVDSSWARKVIVSINRGVRDVAFHAWQAIQRKEGTLDLKFQTVMELIHQYAQGNLSVASNRYAHEIEAAITFVTEDIRRVLTSDEVLSAIDGTVTRFLVTGGASQIFGDEIYATLGSILGTDFIKRINPAIYQHNNIAYANCYGAWCLLASNGNEQYFKDNDMNQGLA